MPSVLITGANRGLGLEFLRQYLSDGWRVHACARNTEGELAQLAKENKSLTLHVLDVTDHKAVDALAKKLQDEAIDVLINNAGIFGPSGFDGGGQNLAGMDYDLWRKAFETNTIAPFKMAQAFQSHLARGERKCLVLLSTEMASLSRQTRDGMTSTAYQSSKAALNMVGVVLSHELKDKGIAVLMLHPGWVATDMGGASAPLKAPQSVSGMRKLIQTASLKDTGSYRDYTGRLMAW